MYNTEVMKPFQRSIYDSKSTLKRIINKKCNVSLMILKKVLCLCCGVIIIIIVIVIIHADNNQQSAMMIERELVNMTIIYWSKIFGEEPHKSHCMAHFIPNKQILCNVSYDSAKQILVKITDDHRYEDSADAFIFHCREGARKKQENDTYISHCQESPSHNNGIQSDSRAMSKFDLSMTYDFDSDIVMPYIGRTFFETLFAKEPIYSFEQKTKFVDHSNIAWIGSNCNAKNGRQDYLKDLFSKINVDSFGKCLNNKAFPKEIDAANKARGSSPKARDLITQSVMSKYKFYLSVENSNCKDYVTEKLKNAINATTIPIVFSVNNVPNYLKFLPPHSFINIADFDSTDDLANYLNKVANDKDLYDAYFWYKKNESMLNALKYDYPSFEEPYQQNQICRIAEAVLKYKQSGVKKKLNADRSCLQKNVMNKYI